MVVGLQGSGKTTFVAKLGRYLKSKGKRPLLVAADLQRPAAQDQLQVLGDSIGVPVFRGESKNSVEVCEAALKQARRISLDPVIHRYGGPAARRRRADGASWSRFSG